jgi:hypothetical protein
MYHHPYFQKDKLSDENLKKISTTFGFDYVYNETPIQKRRSPRLVEIEHLQVVTETTPEQQRVIYPSPSSTGVLPSPMGADDGHPGSATLYDLIAAANFDENMTAWANADDTDSFSPLDYTTPQKNSVAVSSSLSPVGLTPLANKIHPTFDTPGFNSVTSIPTTPHD